MPNTRPILTPLLLVLASLIAVITAHADPRLPTPATAPAIAGVSRPHGPAISIIIDDVGYNLAEGQQAVDLPGAVTLAFLPHTPYADRLARAAYRQGKQVMLHLPMAAEHDLALGPGGLTLGMDKITFLRTLRADLAAIPHVAGVNNHMGSLLTQHTRQMRWLMHDLMYRGGDLFFVDSRTSSETVAQHVAMNNGIANTRRNVFLDNVQQDAAIRRQFDALIAYARHHGTAVGIGHPHPTTLRTLAELLPRLAAQGIRLVPVSTLIRLQHPRRQHQWQASLSPSHQAAKNSKPSPSSTCCAAPVSRLSRSD